MADKAAGTEASGIVADVAIVKQMVEALNGRIELSSKVGVGSTFTVFLPLHASDCEMREADHATTGFC